MATYYGTYGQKVQYLASDPASPQNGQVWFNSTSNLLKVGISQIGVWASGGNLTTARQYPGGAGTQTSSLAFGSRSPTAGTWTEEFTGGPTVVVKTVTGT